MRLRCRSNKLKLEDGETITIKHLTVGNDYEVFFTATMKTTSSNIVLFFNDNKSWTELASNKAIEMFEPIPAPVSKKY